MPATPALHSFAYALDYLREQVADVSADEMATPAPNVANHPAWVIGHLTLTCQLVAGAIGVPEWLPDDFPSRFGTGSSPIAGPAGHESKDEMLGRLRDAQDRVTAAIGKLTDTQLDQPFPDPSYLDVFPTIRHCVTQALVGHASFHVGQLSMWRKAMGLPRMTRGFE
jgi:hypothetical protein